IQENLSEENKKFREENNLLREEVISLKTDMLEVADEVNDTKTSIYTSIITILGIFTAIVFGVFGGMEILGNVMENISDVKISKLLIFSSLLIAAVLTILCLLMNGIADLTNLSIRSCGCTHTNQHEHSVYQQHPVYIAGMIISVYLFTVGVIAHGFQTSNFHGIKVVDE